MDQIRRAERSRGEEGAALILALVFMLVISVSIVSLANLTVSGSRNTVVLRAQTTLETDARSLANATIQAVRTNFAFPRHASDTSYGSNGILGSAQQCDPPGTLSYSHSSLSAYCEATRYTGTASRLLEVFVCKGSTDCTALVQNQMVVATATFVDVPPGDAPTSAACSSPTQIATCGVTMQITYWDVPLANH